MHQRSPVTRELHRYHATIARYVENAGTLAAHQQIACPIEAYISRTRYAPVDAVLTTCYHFFFSFSLLKKALPAFFAFGCFSP
jgi:hypothetical protein